MLKNKDFCGGLMLMGIGAGAVIIARDYHFGSVLHMGPGFFPTILGGILFLFGLSIMIKGLLKGEKIKSNFSLRAFILLPLSIVLFGLIIDYLGLIPALIVLIFGSALAGREFKAAQVGLLTAILTTLSIALFIWGLGLPFPLIKGF